MRLTRLVAATRYDRETFWQSTLLGRSLRLLPDELRPELCLRFDNFGPRCEGLSTLYNQAIDSCSPNQNLLFIHDDVYLHDAFVQHRVEEGLQRFDIIGLAGSRGSDPEQPSWGLSFDDNLEPNGWQRPEHVLLSGAVSHALSDSDPNPTPPPPVPSIGLYGNFPTRCDLLDGLFLAARADQLQRFKVRFDEQFRFHLYDLDFCRTASARGLVLGTWPVLVTHGSGGNFSSVAFKSAARRYLDKWAKATEPPSDVLDTLPSTTATLEGLGPSSSEPQAPSPEPSSSSPEPRA